MQARKPAAWAAAAVGWKVTFCVRRGAGRAGRPAVDPGGAHGGVEDAVDGLARRVGYTPRHLSRLLAGRARRGSARLARARRAQTARVLIETTDLSFADIAFAAGFASVRQFNDTVREVYAASPTQLRGRRGGRGQPPARCTMRLAVRAPFAGRALLDFLATTVPGVEAAGPGWYARTLGLPHGPGIVRLELTDRLAGQTASCTRASRCTTCATRRPRWSAPGACSTPTATRSRSTTRSPTTP